MADVCLVAGFLLVVTGVWLVAGGGVACIAAGVVLFAAGGIDASRRRR